MLTSDLGRGAQITPARSMLVFLEISCCDWRDKLELHFVWIVLQTSGKLESLGAVILGDSP
jgi:hypothetical protein